MNSLFPPEAVMLEKTITFWRRLVHKTPESSGSAVAVLPDERRLWVRYTADLNAQVELTQPGGSQRISVQVRDLSLGGANLLSEVPFPTGQLLTLELASADEVRTVLACVVRCLPEGQQRWSIGCVFSRELTADDLAAFGARPVKTDRVEQRQWQRFNCNLQAYYQLVGDPDNQTAQAQVLNISACGIGLQLGQPLETGSLLSLDLLDRDGQLVRNILACVVHTALRGTGEVAVGCNFIRELAEDELRSLV